MRKLGQPSAADQRLAMAEELCRRADITACGGVMAQRASNVLNAGDLKKAGQKYLEAYQFALNHHDTWRQANTSLNLGYIGLQTDRLDEAIDWSRLSYQISLQHGYDGVAETAAGNVGFAWYRLGDGERALERYEEAEKNAELLGDEDDQFGWLSDKSYVYRDRGEFTRAEELEQRALGLARAAKNQEQIMGALCDLAMLEISKEDLKEAEAHLTEALQIATGGGRKPQPVLVLIQGELAAAQHHYADAEGFFRALLTDTACPTAVRLNAGNDLGRTYEDEKKYEAAEREYRETVAAFEKARAAIRREESALSFGANATGIYGNYVRFLVERGRTADALLLANQSRARTLMEGLGAGQGRAVVASAILRPEEIARKTGTTLLFYWLGDKESYLWAVGPEKTEFSTLPASQQIATWVKRYNKAIQDAGDRDTDLAEAANADGVTLYAALIAPARKVMDARRPVVVLADGVLDQLNFETLLAPGAGNGEKETSGPERSGDSAREIAGVKGSANLKDSAAGRGQHYLLEDYTLLSAPSLDLLARDDAGKAKSDTAAGNLLLIGNAAAADADFPPLPLFGVEMTRIAGRFATGNETVFTGAKATPAAYETANPERFTYIHFVSHATASATSPLDSAVILSNPQDAGNGVSAYKLYAREIVTHKLTARLVTISACYGTGTRAYAGEGLVGLSWAFLHAGARQVVAALWEVTDESTPRLMDGLYAGIVDGKRPAVALRESKLAMLHSGTKFREPFYWAPFVIYGRE